MERETYQYVLRILKKLPFHIPVKKEGDSLEFIVTLSRGQPSIMTVSCRGKNERVSQR
jgi:hypothetical protein